MFKFEDGKCYRMPAHFGGYPYQPSETCYHDVVSVAYTLQTDGDRLSAYIPEGYELIRPEFTIAYCQCREVDWLAGSSYNLIEVAAPVRFSGRRDRVEGNFSLVVWENKTTPILTGREETGIAKLPADIEDLHRLGPRRFTAASYEGNTFLRLEMALGDPLDEAALAGLRHAPVNVLGWRYIPKVGGPGAELSQPIIFPQRVEAKSAWRGQGSIQWTALSSELNPRQFHIIEALAGLPAGRPSVLLVQGAIYLMASQARVLE